LPVIVASAGGGGGGKAEFTATGQSVIRAYRKVD
jgi:molybdate transport repressor ModE-like protein